MNKKMKLYSDDEKLPKQKRHADFSNGLIIYKIVDRFSGFLSVLVQYVKWKIWNFREKKISLL